MNNYQNHQNPPVRPQPIVEDIFYDVFPIGPDGNLDVESNPAGDTDGMAEPETQEEFRTQVGKGPPEPSPQERDQHESTGHAVFRSWCGPCVAGRGRAQAHSSQEHSSDVTAVVSWDYGFLSSKAHKGTEDEEAARSGQSPVLCARDRMSQTWLWYLLPYKGTEFATASAFTQKVGQDLSNLG